jgi:hypothetical protein
VPIAAATPGAGGSTTGLNQNRGVSQVQRIFGTSSSSQAAADVYHHLDRPVDPHSLAAAAAATVGRAGPDQGSGPLAGGMGLDAQNLVLASVQDAETGERAEATAAAGAAALRRERASGGAPVVGQGAGQRAGQGAGQRAGQGAGQGMYDVPAGLNDSTAAAAAAPVGVRSHNHPARVGVPLGGSSSVRGMDGTSAGFSKLNP